MAQTPLPIGPDPRYADEMTRLGIPAHLTEPGLQSDVFKELINKFAWAVGSTYRRSYNQRRSNVRVVALELAIKVLESEGYPSFISKDLSPVAPVAPVASE